MDRLSEIRERCEAFEDSSDSYKGVRPQYILPVLADDGYSRNWAEIAAHSHDDIPYLLEEIERLQAENKREKVMSAIAPICKAFGITDYDYIVKETGQHETLRLYETMIGCTDNSVDAVIDEVIGWLFVNRYCKNRCIGAFRTQTLNAVRRYWIKS